MTSKYLLTHSNSGIVLAKQEIVRAKSIQVDQFKGRSASASDAPAPPTKAQSAPRHTIGVWSLDDWLADLGGLIDRLNGVQSTFAFYEVDAAVPAGLISQPERVAAWYREAKGRKPRKSIQENLADNLIAEEFFSLAEKVRTDLTLDYVIGVTPSMVAGTDEKEIYWNHFSTFSGRTVLASSYQLHDFVSETGWPLAAFLGKIIISQLLVALMWPKLYFHPDTGCLFDYDASRVSLKRKVMDPHIEPDCVKKLKPEYVPSALAFVDLLRSYGDAR
jgi:hypothetical protein